MRRMRLPHIRRTAPEVLATARAQRWEPAEGLYRLIDAAYARRSVAVSSNPHPSGFDEIMPKTIAAVLL